jgi:hypothetical protein
VPDSAPFPRMVPLEARPYRPGELPQRVLVRCAPELATRTANAAARAGLPLTLWVRIAVEASRVRDDLARLTSETPQIIEAGLDAVTGGPLPAAHGCAELSHYARALRSAPSERPAENRSADCQPMVPDTIKAAWTLEAARAARTLDGWIASRLDHAPSGATAWEAEAASRGLSIGEWAYNCWLAAPPASRAAAQTVD